MSNRRSGGLRVSVFVATSLDGYLARPNGDLDWLDEASALVPQGQDLGYGELMASVDALVLGRHTYEKVRGFGSWPYVGKRVVVLSNHPVEIPAPLTQSVSFAAGNPRDLVTRLEEDGCQHLYVDGGITIQRFLAQGLVDEMTITWIPVLLGQGRPLFGPVDADIRLELIAARSYAFGFVQTKYRLETGERPHPEE